MKRNMLIVIAILAMLVPALGFSAAKAAWTKAGNVSAEVGVHYSWYGLGVGGGAEIGILDIPIADITSLQLGGAVRGFADILPWWNNAGLAFGVGGLVTLHWSPKTLGMSLSYLENLDLYIELGIGLTIAPGYAGYGLGNSAPGGIGLWHTDGVKYYFNNALYGYAEYNYLGGGWASSGGTLGLGFKI